MSTRNGFNTREIRFDEIETVSKILASAFLDDRFTSYLSGATSSPTNVDSPEGQTVALQFSLFVHSTFLDGGRTVVAVNEEGVIGAIAVWFGPRKRADLYSFERMIRLGSWRLIWRWGLGYMKRAAEFHHIVDRDFAQAFKDKGSLDPLDSWHLQLIMTVKEFEGKGLMSLLQREGYRHAVETSAAKGEKPKPICLEATSESARDRYTFLGYEVIPNQPVVVGKGEVDANGLKTSNLQEATGIKMYCMVNWEPNPDYRR